MRQLALLLILLSPTAAFGQAASQPVFAQFPGQSENGAIVAHPVERPLYPDGSPSGIGLAIPVDTNGNGRPDLLVCHAVFPPVPEGNYPCRFLRTQPDGTLDDASLAVLASGVLPRVQHPREVVVADFSGDGRPDVFVADTGYDAPPFHGALNVLLVSNGDGTYSDRSSTLPQTSYFSHSACVGDVNRDGKPDIYVGNIGTPTKPYFLLGNGDGTFAMTRNGLELNESFLSCVIADVDDDGHPDLVLGVGDPIQSSASVIYFNDGAGDFTKQPRATLPAGPLGAGNTLVQDIVVHDVNGDGLPDLLLASTQNIPAYRGMALQVLINRGGGVFVDETPARLGPDAVRTAGEWCSFLYLVDINGDGVKDLHCNSPGPDETLPRFWLGTKQGTWTPVAQDPLPAALRWGHIHSMDIDGDGRPDLLRVWTVAQGDVVYHTFRNLTPRGVPSEPIIRAAIAGNAQASIVFGAPVASVTAPVTQYTATCSPGPLAASRSVAGVGSPITVAGLTNGTFYACAVTATTTVGTSLPSAALSVRPTNGLHTVLEFYNPALDHFFITANPPEQVAVASGAAGADWQLTGTRFHAGGPEQVCRFYGSVAPGPNSHFYTIDSDECQALKVLQAGTPGTEKRWNFESNDFSSAAPVAGHCPAGMVPVYRAYNNGFAHGVDSNHRITSNPYSYQAQLAKGWIGEGIVMCAPL